MAGSNVGKKGGEPSCFVTNSAKIDFYLRPATALFLLLWTAGTLIVNAYYPNALGTSADDSGAQYEITAALPDAVRYTPVNWDQDRRVIYEVRRNYRSNGAFPRDAQTEDKQCFNAISVTMHPAVVLVVGGVGAAAVIAAWKGEHTAAIVMYALTIIGLLVHVIYASILNHDCFLGEADTDTLSGSFVAYCGFTFFLGVTLLVGVYKEVVLLCQMNPGAATSEAAARLMGNFY